MDFCFNGMKYIVDEPVYDKHLIHKFCWYDDLSLTTEADKVVVKNID